MLEGIHVVKHALRFGAELEVVLAADAKRALGLFAQLAPDLVDALRERIEVVPAEVFSRLAPVAHHSGLVALARRPLVDLAGLFDPPDLSGAPVVVLEDPARLSNVGTTIRVAAAAGAAAVVVMGHNDPWHPEALRTAAGLQFALPVVSCEVVPPSRRPLVVLDPEGDTLTPGSIPAAALIVFGNERRGISDQLGARADLRLAIPMAPGVSSLNLATAVAVVLYSWRWVGRSGGLADPARRL